MRARTQRDRAQQQAAAVQARHNAARRGFFARPSRSTPEPEPEAQGPTTEAVRPPATRETYSTSHQLGPEPSIEEGISTEDREVHEPDIQAQLDDEVLEFTFRFRSNPCIQYGPRLMPNTYV